jgi:hypothetical protein
MQMQRKLWLSFFVAGLMAGTLSAQQAPQPDPSPDAHLVRIRTGSYVERCVGYCDTETIIEPSSVRMISRSFSDKKKYPEKNFSYAISKKDWEALQQLIDANVLAAFKGRIGCPGCADAGVEWVEIEFSDGTKKSASYNAGRGPERITALLQRIKTIAAKPPKP